MFKKLFVGIIAVVISILCLSTFSKHTIYADDSILTPSELQYANPPLQINHEYTAFFQPDGEAFFVLKAVIFNRTGKPLSQFQFTLPNIKIQDLTVLEIKRRGKDYYGGSGDTTYEKTPYAITNGILTTQLLQPISGAGSFLLYYRTYGYTTKKANGDYLFSFESLKTTDDLFSVRLGASVNNGLTFTQDTNAYHYPSYDMTKISAIPQTETAAPLNFDAFYNELGSGSQLLSDQLDDGRAPGTTQKMNGEYKSTTTSVSPYVIFSFLAFAMLTFILWKTKKISKLFLSSLGSLLLLIVCIYIFITQQNLAPVISTLLGDFIILLLFFIFVSLFIIGISFIGKLVEKWTLLSPRFASWLQEIYTLNVAKLFFTCWVIFMIVPTVLVSQIDPGYGIVCFTPFTFLLHLLAKDYYTLPIGSHVAISFPCSIFGILPTFSGNIEYLLLAIIIQSALLFMIVLLFYILSAPTLVFVFHMIDKILHKEKK